VSAAARRTTGTGRRERNRHHCCRRPDRRWSPERVPDEEQHPIILSFYSLCNVNRLSRET